MAWLRGLFGSGSGPPDHTEQILTRHLDRDMIVYPMGEGAATRQMVEHIATRFGVRFPPEFVSHVCGRLPGAYVAAKENVWPRPRAYDVGPFWTFLYAVHSFTPLPTSQDWMRLDRAAEHFQDRTGLRAAPILKLEGSADQFCVDSSGSILAYDGELNELTSIEMGFWQLFEREVAELVERKSRRVSEAVNQ